MKLGRPTAFLALAAALLASLAFAAVGRPTAGADPVRPTGLTVTATPTSGLVDSQVMTINVKGTPDLTVYRAEAHECRSLPAGTTYKTSTEDSYDNDFALGGPNCPPHDHPISTGSDYVAVDSSTQVNAATPDGESFNYRAGTGVTSWTSFVDHQTVDLTCDSSNPCSLVVEALVQVGSDQPFWQPTVIPLAFGDSDPLAGCGGVADSVLSSAGSDRISDAWVSWTKGICAAQGHPGAPTRASFPGEGNALLSFDGGVVDLAYTAGGFDDSIGLIPPGGTHRAAVAVPVAIDGAMAGVFGGYRNGTVKVPYKDIKATSAEMAGLFTAGPSSVDQSVVSSLIDRNAELQKSGSSLFDNSAGFLVGAYADAEMSSWQATGYFDKLAGSAWVVPNNSSFANDSGKDRGQEASLALADPSFSSFGNAFTLLSGRPALVKGLLGPSPTSSGGVWMLTDTATAGALGVTPIQITNKNGDFVGPTAASLQAAIPTMKENSEGILVADPSAVAPEGSTQPYPMTMVEYALVPAEPILDDSCKPNAARQGLLDQWLRYITSDAGQALLPKGMVALTPDLRAVAAQRLALVGKAAVTGDCAASQQQPDSNGGGSGGGGGGGGTTTGGGSDGGGGGFVSTNLPGGSSGYALPPTGSGSGAGPAAESTPPSSDDTAKVALVDVPSYQSPTKSSSVKVILALLGIIGMASIAAFATSRAT